MRMARAFDSGMECATGTNSMSKGPSAKRPPWATMFISTLGAPGSESRRVASRPAAKRVHQTGTRSEGQSAASAPIWSSWAWVMTMPSRLARSSMM